MKNNKNKLNKTEKFQESLMVAMENYYREALS